MHPLPNRSLLDALNDYCECRGWKLALRFVDADYITIPAQTTIANRPDARRVLIIHQGDGPGPLFARELYPNAATLEEFALLLFECIGVPITELQDRFGAELLDVDGDPIDLTRWP